MPRVRDDTRGRRERIPMGTPEAKLAAEQRTDFVRYWANDTPGRIERFKLAGYHHVREDGEEGKQNRTAIVGVNTDGSAMIGYLMEIPKVLYDEDQAAKQKPLDEFDKILRRGNITGANPNDKDAFYVPDEGIHVSTE